MKKSILLFFVSALIIVACQNSGKKMASGESVLALDSCVNTYSVTDSTQIERDDIYSLLSLAVVYKDWQTESTVPVRGYNIGSVLVAPSGEVVKWARNCVDTTGNSTQHGEVRLMTSFLQMTEYFSLADQDDAGYVIYTSLEPCAMCSGMMTLQSVHRTVYTQTDPDYGKAIQRLEFNASGCSGCPPYPRSVVSDVSPSMYRVMLDTAYSNYLKKGGVRSITKWLTSTEAENIYAQATQALLNYSPKYSENSNVLHKAIDFYNNVVSDKYTPSDVDGGLFTTVFKISGNKTGVDTTNTYKTFGGKLYNVSSDKVFTTLFDTDGDVFFKVVNQANPAEYAIIDSGGVPTGGGAYVNVMYQNGISCAIKFRKMLNNVYYYEISPEITHDNDCKWNGSKCVQK